MDTQPGTTKEAFYEDISFGLDTWQTADAFGVQPQIPEKQ